MTETRASSRRQVAVVAAQQTKALTGNRAAAEAAKLARVRAGMFYPIGPADEVMEEFRGMISRGELEETAEVLQMENEKAIISAQLSIGRNGIRTMFSTCSVGLIWAYAQMKSAHRTPLMIVCPSRSLSGGVSADYEDFTSQRDLGWLMFYCENAQDVLDTVLQAYKIAEDRRVSLPVIVGYDGWEVSHSTYRCSVPSQEDVDAFLPRPYLPPEEDMLTENWAEITKGRREFSADSGYTQEADYKHWMAMERAKAVIDEVGQEYQQMFGRDHVGPIETYKTEDADVILLAMGGSATTSRVVADALRERGDRVGVIKLRVFRPFPNEALVEAVRGAKVVAIVEREPQPVLLTEVKGALFGAPAQPMVLGRVTGIAGRDINYVEISAIAEEALEAIRAGKVAKEFDYQLRGRSE